MKSTYALWVLMGSLIFTCCFLIAGAAPNEIEAKAAQPAQDRFDNLVRDDFFAGFGGDRAALDHGMQLCEKALSKNAEHAEALVWHGDGLLFLAGEAFQAGDTAKGLDLWGRGLKEMNDAVAMEPDNISVLIARGASFIPSSRYTPEPQARQILVTGVADFELTLRLQKDFDKLSVHARGELLGALADGWLRLGYPSRAERYVERIQKDLEGSKYAQRAAAWLAATERGEREQIARTMTCIGCHK